MNVKNLLVVLMTLNILNGSDLCTELSDQIKTYVDALEQLKNEEPDRELYESHLDRMKKYSLTIQDSECQQSDSLLVELLHHFAEFMSKPQGDLEQYSLLLTSCKERMVRYSKTRESELKKEGRSLDYLRDWIRRKDRIDQELRKLDNKYATLKVYISRATPFTEMTRVMSRASGSLKPVKIHFRAPEDIVKEDINRRRISYLTKTFDMVLSSYDPDTGFYFEIPFLPISSNQDPFPDETYAITFDGRVRYRIHNFHIMQQDILVVPSNPEWVYIEEVPENYTKIELPNNLDFEVWDRSIASFVDKTTLVYVESDQAKTLYLPVDEEGTNNHEIVIKSKKKINLGWLTGISTLIMLGVFLYAI